LCLIKIALKRIAAIFLLLILAFPFWGFYSFYKNEIHQTRKQVKKLIMAGIEKDELTLLKFSINETKNILEWKHSKEFKYNNNMYDVVYRDTVGDTISYHCWKDDKETEIRFQFDTLLAKKMNDNNTRNSQGKKIIDYFKSLFFHSFNQNYLAQSVCSQMIFGKYLLNYYSVDLLISDPPPKSA